ncbi:MULTISPECIES: hypothetical protein [Bacillus]|uniref:Uncharacterized protein n=1 Tax=Bacillus mycoides TaxID=1405 RepID=A0A3D9TW24_BACMY|nr:MULTISPECIES: hypothetical protein [Bacillus]RBP25752.1 hypothetical protein DET63_10925 [Bacillus sp. DB-2]REF16981.1 hypothetical protein DET55_1548 [Bacillus mycoides]
MTLDSHRIIGFPGTGMGGFPGMGIGGFPGTGMGGFPRMDIPVIYSLDF